MRTLGSLCAGSGMLDQAVERVLGPLQRLWHADNDPAASRVLAHHWPDVPNLGDLTTIDWAQVEPPDVLTAAFPCQDVSLAGRQAGLHGARSGVWAHVADAVSALQPSMVVIENVEGLHSAKANSDVERCPWCLGDRPDQPALRASGAVLGDLAERGFDAQWVTVPASDVGAPHQRKRVFVLAWRPGTPADPTRGRHGHAGPPRVRRVPPTVERGHPQLAGQLALMDDHAALTELVTDRLLPTPVATPYGSNQSVSAGAARRPGLQEIAAKLLPTPTARDGDGDGRGEGHPDHRRHRAQRTGVNIGGPTLGEVSRHLLPTPRATDGTKGGPNQRGAAGDLMLPSAVQPQRFGAYQTAITRWEQVLGRPAPEPTEPGRDGQPRLSPRFAEWMLGWPDGHVTGVPGVKRNDQLRMIGNGVVPQQAIAAIEHLLEAARWPL